MFLRSCGPRCAKVHLLPVFDLTQVRQTEPLSTTGHCLGTCFAVIVHVNLFISCTSLC